ncbi:MAG: HAD family hydrolase [Thermoflexaceae bacterium]|nr:HAD family hydrolase [Thermoflexaceae bacterium]
MRYPYLFFDLDGTLTDPGMGITNSIIYSLEKFGIKVEDRTSLYPFIGPPLLESYEKYYGFDEEKAKLAVNYYREYFGVKGLFENEVYPGMDEFLNRCRESGCKLVLATSKPEHYAVDIMKHFGLDRYFDCMCGSSMDASLETKADVIRKALKCCNISSTENVLMIGDRKHDILGAKECNIDSAGVLWGYGNREEFCQNGATYIVSNFEELEKVIHS